MLKPWGIHYIGNVYKCKPSAIRSAPLIYDFTKTLVNKIDMKAYGEPQIIHFGSGNKAGYTLVQLIETSNICAHFTEEDNGMYLDVFSCKEFDYKVVEQVVNDYFDPENIDGYMFERKVKPMLEAYKRPGQDKP